MRHKYCPANYSKNNKQIIIIRGTKNKFLEGKLNNKSSVGRSLTVTWW